jgi:hypothetical protein
MSFKSEIAAGNDDYVLSLPVLDDRGYEILLDENGDEVLDEDGEYVIADFGAIIVADVF